MCYLIAALKLIYFLKIHFLVNVAHLLNVHLFATWNNHTKKIAVFYKKLKDFIITFDIFKESLNSLNKLKFW